MYKKIIIISIIISFLLTNFSFVQAKDKNFLSLSSIETAFSQIPSASKAEIDKETAEEIVKEQADYAKKAWDEYVFPFYKRIWQWLNNKVFSPVKSWLIPEAEKRKDYFIERVQTEKEEIKEDIKEEIPKISQSLWQRIKDFFK